MKTLAIAALALTSAVCASPALAARTHFKASLDSQVSGALGSGTFTFDDGTKVLCGTVTYNGLTGGALTGAALKNATNGSSVKALPAGASPLAIDVVLSAAEQALLQTVPGPGLYIALGNGANPVSNAPDDNGELNGELLVDKPGIDACPVPDGGSDAGGKDAGDDAGDGSGAADSGAPPPSAPESSSGGTPPDGSRVPGASAPPAATEDPGGCSTTGTASTGGALLAGIVALTLVRRVRARRS